METDTWNAPAGRHCSSGNCQERDDFGWCWCDCAACVAADKSLAAMGEAQLDDEVAS